jgi:2-desacetyl-2-hydroxyethyl bacteriochlorophyllide A dehydrogenase
MRCRSLYFTGPRTVEIREETVAPPGSGEVLVRAAVSAISAGTELLVYRGELEEGALLDESLPALNKTFHYPARYGYASVGEVVDVGAGVDESWRGRRVFAFEPHGSHFVAETRAVFPLPDGMTTESGTFLPTLETAINLTLDAAPLIGERVLVVGQGMIGMALTAVLARFPLERLWTTDTIEARRDVSLRMGAERSFSPDELPAGDFDLVFEVSGSPQALGPAIAAAGLESRVVVGSWYGKRRAAVDFGTHFHRNRVRIVSSQVSHLGACLGSRWSQERRLRTAARLLAMLPVDELVSHRFPIEDAAEAYRLVDQNPSECREVLLTYT